MSNSSSSARASDTRPQYSRAKKRGLARLSSSGTRDCAWIRKASSKGFVQGPAWRKVVSESMQLSFRRSSARPGPFFFPFFFFCLLFSAAYFLLFFFCYIIIKKEIIIIFVMMSHQQEGPATARVACQPIRRRRPPHRDRRWHAYRLSRRETTCY